MEFFKVSRRRDTVKKIYVKKTFSRNFVFDYFLVICPVNGVKLHKLDCDHRVVKDFTRRER